MAGNVYSFQGICLTFIIKFATF